MQHEQFISSQQRNESLFLKRKELSYLRDRSICNEDSDNEEQVVHKKFDENIIQLKRKRTSPATKKSIGYPTYSRRLAYRSYLQILRAEYELFQIRLYKMQKKLRKLIELKPPYVIAPNGTLKLLWDLICFLIILYQLVAVPIQLSFSIEEDTTLNYVTIVIFMMDILFTFNTAIYLHGNIIESRKEIFKDYIRLWFWIDIFSTIPYDIIIDGSMKFVSSARLLRLLRFLRFVKMLKLMRLAKLKIIFDKIDELVSTNKTAEGILTFIKLFIIMVFLGHLLGCIFHFVGAEEDPESSYLQTYELDYDEWYIQYVHSLYWGIATMTTVGYGDISPQTFSERLTGVFLLLIACGGFAFTMNSIGTVLQTINERSSVVKLKLSSINQYSKKAQLPNILNNRIRKYLAFIWEYNKIMVIEDLIDNLSNDLSLMLKYQINGKFIGYIDIFWMKDFHVANTKDLVNLMQEKLYSPNEIIFEEVQTDNCLYIISMGEVQLSYSKTKVVIDIKKQKDYFGEIAFFANRVRTATAQSVSFATLFSIKQEEFVNFIRHDNQKIQQYYEIRHKINFQSDYGCIKIKCYTCQMDDHICIQCPKLHFQIDPTHFLRFLHEREQYKYSLFQRKDRIDFNSRKHKDDIASQARTFIHNLRAREYSIQFPPELSNLESLSVIDEQFTQNKIQPTVTETEIELMANLKVDYLIQQLQSRNRNQEELFLQFSILPDFDRAEEYKYYQTDNNISTVLLLCHQFQTQGFTHKSIHPQKFGYEELKAFADFYSYPLDNITQNTSQNKFNMNFEQLRIGKLDRVTKKRLQHIQTPLKTMEISFLVLRAAKMFKSGLKSK